MPVNKRTILKTFQLDILKNKLKPHLFSLKKIHVANKVNDIKTVKKEILLFFLEKN